MTAIAKKTHPKLWDEVKQAVTDGDRGGRPGQWSARKAQLAVAEYKKQGGGYEGRKSEDNHLQQWTDEAWGTKSGKPSGRTGERYLPRRARQHLSDSEYQATTEKKRADTQKGRQFSRQPQAIARKTAADRSLASETRATLMARAKKQGIHGRSRMSKADLLTALR
jgi:hypothetical protein